MERGLVVRAAPVPLVVAAVVRLFRLVLARGVPGQFRMVPLVPDRSVDQAVRM